MTLPERLVAGEIALADYPIALSVVRNWAEGLPPVEDIKQTMCLAIIAHMSINHVRQREGDEAADILSSILLGE